MTSSIERFRNRVNAAMVIDVPLSAQSNELILKVERFAEEEKRAARLDAETVVRKLGLLAADDFISDKHTAFPRFQVEFCCALARYVEKHVKDWQHTPPPGEEPLRFSRGSIKELIGLMDQSELLDLGLSYLAADAAADDKKKDSPPMSAETTG